MELLQSDLSARTNPRLDGNEEPCALIKVIIPAVEGMQFEGWVIGNVQYRPGEYQVYVPSGTKKITFRHPDYAPGEIRFTLPIEGKCTYRVILAPPQKTGGLESVEQGDAAAMLKQAKNYEQGTGSYSRNIEQAQEWYEKAAEAGNVEAQEYLAEILYKGTNGFAKNTTKALRWNEECAKQGKEPFIHRTAELYKGLNQNEQAIKWYKKYNELHPDKDLQMLIAQLHSKDHPDRNKWLKTAADNGHVEAAYELATRLAPIDASTATFYYQKAVDGNHIMAMNDYGTYLITGKYGIAKDETKGQNLINRAIDGGNMNARTSMIKATEDMSQWVVQIPMLLNAVKNGDPEAILKLLLIYKALGDKEMELKLYFTARYNFAFDLPDLESIDVKLLGKAGFNVATKIIDPKTSEKRFRQSNFECMIEYLGSLRLHENEKDSKTYNLLEHENLDVLNRLFHKRCSSTQNDMNKAFCALDGGKISFEFSEIAWLAREYYEKDIMEMLEKIASEDGRSPAVDIKYSSLFKEEICKIWGISNKFQLTQYDIRIIKALIEYRNKTHEGQWKKEIKLLQEWLTECKIPNEIVAFTPWIKQLREENFLWDEKTAKNAITIVAHQKEERKVAAEEKEKNIKEKGNKVIRDRSRKMHLTTFEANGVAFNIVFVKKGQIGHSGNFCNHDFYVMETPITSALWNAIMDKTVNSDDYSVYMSGNYMNWLQKKTYYGNIWKNAKYNMKENDITSSDLNEFIKRLSSITKKKFRIINIKEARLITANKTTGVILPPYTEDYTSERWDGESRVIRLVY